MRTWNGGGADNNVGNLLNWGGTAPVSNDDLVFSGTLRLTPNLVAALTIRSISFTNGAGAFTLGGAAYTIGSAGITNNSTNTQTISSALVLGSAQTWTANTGALSVSGAITNAVGLTSTGSSNSTFSGVISGIGGLTKTGSGTLTLSGTGANTYTGATVVNEGTLQLNKTTGFNAFNGTLTIGDASGVADSAVTRLTVANQIPGQTVALRSDGLLDLNGFSDVIGALNMTGGNVTTGLGVLTLGGDVTTSAAASTATISGNLALAAARTFTIADGAAAVDLQIGAVVSGNNFAITKSGTGTMVLSGANTYTGATNVSAGVLNVRHALALGTIAGGVTVSSGAALQVEGNVAIGAEALSLNGAGIAGSGALRSISGTNSHSGAITLAAASTVGVDAGTLTLSGVISGTSGLTKTGAGTLSLQGPAANTYSGGTTINGGRVLVNSASSLGATGGRLTLNAGILQLITGYSTTRLITVGDAGSTFEIDPAQTFTATGIISGTGTLNKTGAGTMVLGAANAYSGGTVVGAGELQLGTSNRLLDAGSILVSGGTFNLQTHSDIVGGVTLRSGAITGSGTLTGSSYLVESGSISAVLAGIGSLTKDTAGTVTLTGVNTYSGGSTINAGTVVVGNAAGLGANTGGLTLNAGTLRIATGFTTTRAISLGSSASTISVDSAQLLTIGTTPITGSGTLNKAGSGTLVLAGANTYTGATLVNAGLLSVSANGALGSVGSGTTVASGGALRLSSVNYLAAEPLTINGSGISNGGALVNSRHQHFRRARHRRDHSTINAGGGILTFTGGLAKNGTTLTIAGGGTVNINTHGISGSSPNSDLVVDSTTVVLNAANSYNGPTTVQNSGTLQPRRQQCPPDLAADGADGEHLEHIRTRQPHRWRRFTGGRQQRHGHNSAAASTSTLTVNPRPAVSTTFAGRSPAQMAARKATLHW